MAKDHPENFRRKDHDAVATIGHGTVASGESNTACGLLFGAAGFMLLIAAPIVENLRWLVRHRERARWASNICRRHEARVHAATPTSAWVLALLGGALGVLLAFDDHGGSEGANAGVLFPTKLASR